MSSQHVSVLSGNVKVFFPFQPYAPQQQYIDSVIEALSSKQNAILESPTGTGKTLSLLCSTLAWLQSQSGAKCLIYYTSRTHMQLSQAAKEMKRTAYSKIPAVVLGSRAKMCLNDEVRHHGGDHLINRACRNAIAKNACDYYSNYEHKLEVLEQNEVHDIEDLGQFGRTNRCCPYYAAKKIAETKATLVFMPYNYLLDTSIRKSLQLKLENSIIIFDEAHNIEGVLKDSVSGSITLLCLNTIRESCLQLPSKIHDALMKEKHGLSRTGFKPKKKAPEVVNEFDPTGQAGSSNKEVKVNPIEELAEKLTNDRLQMVNKCVDLLQSEVRKLDMDKTDTSAKLFHVMNSSGVNYSTSDSLITTLDAMASFWSIAGVMDPAKVSRYVTATTNLCNIVSLLYPTQCISLTRQTANEKRLNEFYTIYLEGIYEDSRVLQRGPLKNWTLHLWCLLPAIGLSRMIDSNCINGPRSLIVTSGTLAPMRAMAKELETEFKVIKEFDHVIGDNQLKICIIGESPSSYSLESHYQATVKKEYPIAIGKTLVPLIQVLPFGTLIFFQSYSLMNRIIKFWKEKSTIWKEMTACSTILVESNQQDSFLTDVSNYKRIIDGSGKAVFFGVFRGKLSEGVNFEGNHCRSVVLLGFPFPNIKDPKIIATRKFHEKRTNSEAGKIWYSQQMLRALNQSIGRVIRSKNDFGALILCDPRFKSYKYSLSTWVRKFYPLNQTSIGDAANEIKQFFLEHRISISQTASETCGAFDISISSSVIPRQAERTISSRDTMTAPRRNNPFKAAAQASDDNRASAKDKTEAMINSYTVDKTTYDKVQESRAKRLAEETSQNKKAKVTTQEAFAAIYAFEPSQPFSSQNSNTTSVSKDLSILEQAKDNPNTGAKYKCYICKNQAITPFATNCRCSRVGCFKCVMILDKKSCGDCKEIILAKKFKPRYFHSASLKNEKLVRTA